VKTAFRHHCGSFLASAVVIGIALAFSAPAPANPLPRSTLVVGTRAEPRTLNPVAITASEGHQIAGLVFLKLLEEQDDFMSFKPQLAESWSMGDDGLSVTFVLRNDARWSDGVPVTAQDVRFTWEVHTDTTVAWPSASIKDRIRDVEVRDERTVVFHYSEHYLYQVMDANDGVILPKHVLGGVPRGELKDAPFGRAPLGNGPYRMARWETGQFIELEASPTYFGGRPAVDRVFFKFVPDAVTLVAQLKAHEIDLLESVQPGDLGSIRERRPDVAIHTIPSRRMSFIVWNTEREPLGDRRVRRALTMAIDRAELIRTVWGGYAQECTSPIVPLLWAYDGGIEPLPFDPARARAGLEELGFGDRDGDGVLERNGKPLEIELVVNDAQNRVDVVTIVQAQLRAIGVRVNLRVMEFGAYQQRVLASDFDGAFVEWKVQTRVDLTSMFHSRSRRPRGFNFGAYANPEVDRAIDEALAMSDMEAAKARWNEAQRLIYDDQPYTFIAVPEEITAIDDRFCNVKPDAISFFVNLPAWRIQPDCPR